MVINYNGTLVALDSILRFPTLCRRHVEAIVAAAAVESVGTLLAQEPIVPAKACCRVVGARPAERLGGGRPGSDRHGLLLTY